MTSAPQVLRAAVLLAVGVAGFGWVLPWPDQAQAGAALQWCGWLLLCVVLRDLTADRVLRLAAAAGAGVGLAGAGCTGLSGYLPGAVGACDEATGRPVTAALAVAVLAVSAEVWRGWTTANDNQIC